MAELIFLQALAGNSTTRTPIWLMRQAGRYMSVYRKLREKHSLLDMVKSPELACEVTLQPIQAFGMDAAIIFADILPLLEAMGLNLEFLSGEGPHINNPLRCAEDVKNLRVTPPEETLSFTLDAIKLARRALKNVPLMGFSGAPFTLACYAIEGSGSRDYAKAKRFMYAEPLAWHELMTKLSQMIGDYLVAQAKAGAQALQLFDSWAGALSPMDYAQYVLPYTRAAIQRARSSGVPIIYFSTSTGAYLNLIAKLGADAYSVDWRVNLTTAQEVFKKPIQGNLDPILLLAPWEAVQKGAQNILTHTQRRGFIFNLGHGILQQTPEDNIKRLVNYVQESLP